ncbi:class I SAM-dependent methyltransferase [Paenibacillus sacheonensis]|uniref:Class I SAM-dependent methyltransferase n=1 Tax=Paenibacillus sacheonensis TaxID=742054 RepID=A0A7X5BWZ4_9BACL|nr:class I SAM-dependent methyltransferase [Paenibacillus sacheonensis]MBM7563388.1 16S rRNA G966 N2-methylase RsmD [Paenibacillus sacheonensis]NBC68057.1 class I SAM-dependent methyltransferase [Paenibacillus sacheonensis]
MIVTTAQKPTPEQTAYAQAIAAELEGRFVPRKQDSLQLLGRKYEDPVLLVADDRGLRYYEDSKEPLYFHPSMAYVRVKRMRKGERDPLIALTGCLPGDSVIDCTAGLGSDSIVFSYGVGASGKVTALESERVLYTVVREGLRSYRTGHEDVNDALRRIGMRCIDHLSYLKQQADKSADIVYFDPMFRHPLHDSSALAPLRGLANGAALSEESVKQALRVARKCVVLKEHGDSGEFERLGFEKRHRNKIAYGVIIPS